MPNSNPDYQWVKLEKSFFGFEKDLFICLAYYPPTGSSYTVNLENDIFECIEKDIINYRNMGNICLCGDLNSRIGRKNDYM